MTKAGSRKTGRQGRDTAGPGGGAALVMALAFLLSGSAGLIHEVVWVRLLGHVFGVTAFAVGTVLAAYMGGLALGAWMVGRLASRLKNPARVYAWVEMAIGALALAIPFILDGIEPLYASLWRRFHLSFALFSVLRFLVAGSILLAPTMMMGATLPLLVEHFSRRFGRRTAPEWLYTVNLAGAVFGVIAGGFVFLPVLGVWGAIMAGAAMNLAAGLMVLVWSPRPAAPPTQSPAHSPAVSSTSDHRSTARGMVLPAAAIVSGLTCLAAQVAWTRLIALLIGSTTYAFSTVLLVFLAALAAGSVWASMRARRTTDVTAPLAVLAALSAVTHLAAIMAVNPWPSWYWRLFNSWHPAGLAGVVTINTVAVFALLAVPFLLAGTIFPLTLTGAGRSNTGSTSRFVGLLYAVNTTGAILGAVIAGFVIVPWIGSHATLLGVTMLMAALAVGCAMASGNRRVIAGSLAALVVVVIGAVAGPEWDQKTLNAAIYEPQSGIDPREKNKHDSVLYHREGPTATVMVLERPPDVRYMRINGRINASSGPKDIATNVLLAQIPILLAPWHNEILVVGLGSGVTAGAALQSAARTVTVVELEPAVIEASRLFDAQSHAPLDDPRLVLLEDDARHILVASESTYDLIISEPSHPWVSGVANLFTRDFFSLAAKRLRTDGLFVQWLQTYQISRETFLTILATFQSVFPEVCVFRSLGTDLILVGSRSPLQLDLSELEQRWRQPLVQKELWRIGFSRPEALLAHFQTGPTDVKAMVAGAPLNTDDNMRVEFHLPIYILRTEEVESGTILGGITRTPVEMVLRDPDRLLRRRDSLNALVDSLDARHWPSERYRALLAGR